MKTTLEIGDELLRRAASLTGVEETDTLVRLALEALIARETSRRLAALGGAEEALWSVRRTRPVKPSGRAVLIGRPHRPRTDSARRPPAPRPKGR